MLRTSLSYKKRASLSCSYYNHQPVIELDTSVNTALENSNSDVDSVKVQGEFVDNSEPVVIYGNSLLMTEYDPIAAKRRSAARASEAQHSQVDSSANNVQQNTNTAAAAQAAAQNVQES